MILMVLVMLGLIVGMVSPMRAAPVDPVIEICRTFQEEPLARYHEWRETIPEFLEAHPQAVKTVVNALEPALDELLSQPLPELDGDPPTPLEPDLNFWRRSFEALAGLGLYQARSGNWREGTACLRSALKVAVCMTRFESGATGGLLLQMGGIHGLLVSLEAIHMAIRYWAGSPEDVRDLVQAVERISGRKAPLSFALQQEFLSTRMLIRDTTRDATYFGYRTPPPDSTVSKALAYYEADARGLYARAAELSREPYYRQRDEWQRLDAEVQRIIDTPEVHWFKAWWNPAWALSRNLVWTLTPNFHSAFRTDTQAQCMIAGTAIAGEARIRFLETGAWPDSMDSLARSGRKDTPVDPCSGLPWILKVNGDTPLIYSVGCNGLDDGGRDKYAEEEGDDILIFRDWGLKSR